MALGHPFFGLCKLKKSLKLNIVSSSSKQKQLIIENEHETLTSTEGGVIVILYEGSSSLFKLFNHFIFT